MRRQKIVITYRFITRFFISVYSFKVVYLGASGEVKGKYASKICKFLGDISIRCIWSTIRLSTFGQPIFPNKTMLKQ
jgi:hypothetical protein